MGGVPHRSVLGKGPPHFREHFKMVADGKMVDPRCLYKHPLVKRSILGLPAVYNLLPSKVKEAQSVRSFQAKLQGMVKQAVLSGRADWADMLSPRRSLAELAAGMDVMQMG